MNALQPLVKQLTKMVKEGYDLGKDQLPEVGKQILRYYFWVNLFQFVVSALGSAVVGFLTFLLYVAIAHADQSMDGRWIGLFILGGLSLGLAAAAYDGLTTLLEVMIAPKVFLLDTISSYL